MTRKTTTKNPARVSRETDALLPPGAPVEQIPLDQIEVLPGNPDPDPIVLQEIQNTKTPPRTRARRPYKKLSDILASDPAAALYARAALISFTIYQNTLWVHETVPDHGQRFAPLRTVQTLAIGSTAAAIVGYLDSVSITIPASRVRNAVLLACEVLPFLPEGWKLTADNLQRFFDRKLSGRDLVQIARDA